jgi:cysteine synthase A
MRTRKERRMGKVYKSLTGLIGKTPLLELSNYCAKNGLKAAIIGKLEYFNPAGSVKDRIAAAMIDDAEKRGAIKAGTVIIEPTSVNTGIGLASVAAAKGYRLILTMPETMSIERRALLKAYGAEIVLTDGAKGMKGAIEKADELAKEIPGSFIPGQFDNPANPAVHKATTGPEIWEDTEGKVDVFVAGMGTGGTISGTGRYLKEHNPDIIVIGADPEGSVLSGDSPKSYKVEGIGEDFVPYTFDRQAVDEMVRVSDAESILIARRQARRERRFLRSHSVPRPAGRSRGFTEKAGLPISGSPLNRLGFSRPGLIYKSPSPPKRQPAARGRIGVK